MGVWRSADRRSLQAVGVLLFAAGIVGLPNHTVFAMSSRWLDPGFNDTMHITLTTVFGLLVFAALVLSAVAYRGWFRTYAIGTLAAAMGFGIASSFAIRGIEQNLTAWAGAFERINAYAYFAWLVVLAVTVMRRSVRAGTAKATDTPEEVKQQVMISSGPAG